MGVGPVGSGSLTRKTANGRKELKAMEQKEQKVGSPGRRSKGIAMEGESAKPFEKKAKQSKKKDSAGNSGPKPKCKCGSNVHQRANSLQCPMNKVHQNPETMKVSHEAGSEQAAVDALGEEHSAIAATLNLNH